MKAKDINDTEINAGNFLENLYRFASLAKIELEDKESVVNFSKAQPSLGSLGERLLRDSNKAVKLGGERPRTKLWKPLL